MPMFNSPMMPQKRPYVPYQGQPVPANGLPQMPPQPPTLPDPTTAAAPPAQPPMTANATGGPTAAQGAIRDGAYTELYRLGRQMPGKANLFAGFGPQPPAAPDPLAALAPPPAPQPRVMPQLPPSAQPPDLASLYGQPQQPMRPIDRFPRAARLMGRAPMPPTRGY